MKNPFSRFFRARDKPGVTDSVSAAPTFYFGSSAAGKSVTASTAIQMSTVLIHELGHCVIFSFNLQYDIHKVVKEDYWLEAEEWLCNFIAGYGRLIFETEMKNK